MGDSHDRRWQYPWARLDYALERPEETSWKVYRSARDGNNLRRLVIGFNHRLALSQGRKERHPSVLEASP